MDLEGLVPVGGWVQSSLSPIPPDTAAPWGHRTSGPDPFGPEGPRPRRESGPSAGRPRRVLDPKGIGDKGLWNSGSGHDSETVVDVTVAKHRGPGPSILDLDGKPAKVIGKDGKSYPARKPKKAGASKDDKPKLSARPGPMNGAISQLNPPAGDDVAEEVGPTVLTPSDGIETPFDVREGRGPRHALDGVAGPAVRAVPMGPEGTSQK
jgi:hypothetical protein